MSAQGRTDGSLPAAGSAHAAGRSGAGAPAVLSLLDPRLLAFNQLPSLTLHPTRRGGYAEMLARLPDGALSRAGLHRLWSRAILHDIGLAERPVLRTGEPALAIALLPGDAMERLAARVGAALCAPRLRTTIAGAEVRQLRETLGGDALDFVHGLPARGHDGLPESRRWSLAETLAALPGLGRSAVLAALQQGGPELSGRAALKLPQGSAADSPLEPRRALALSLRVLQAIEPSWLSSFPAAH